MRHTSCVLSIVLLIMSLSLVSCDRGEYTGEDAKVLIARWDSEHNNPTSDRVIFNLHIEGCSCSERSSFYLTWGAPVNPDLLIQILTEADQDGLLLCDCKEGSGEGIPSSIESMELVFFDNQPGLHIKLKQKTWLYWYDIKSKLSAVFEEHQQELFDKKYFEIS